MVEQRAVRRRYSDEVRAAAVAALLAGQSVSEVAAAYNVPRNTVKSWKSRLAADAPAVTAADPAVQARLGELVAAYLAEAFGTLRLQLEVFRDQEWLKDQAAAEVAVLHGVIADKAVRLLEALADNEPPADGPAAGGVAGV